MEEDVAAAFCGEETSDETMGFLEKMEQGNASINDKIDRIEDCIGMLELIFGCGVLQKKEDSLETPSSGRADSVLSTSLYVNERLSGLEARLSEITRVI